MTNKDNVICEKTLHGTNNAEKLALCHEVFPIVVWGGKAACQLLRTGELWQSWVQTQT